MQLDLTVICEPEIEYELLVFLNINWIYWTNKK